MSISFTIPIDHKGVTQVPLEGKGSMENGRERDRERKRRCSLRRSSKRHYVN